MSLTGSRLDSQFFIFLLDHFSLPSLPYYSKYYAISLQALDLTSELRFVSDIVLQKCHYTR